MKTQKSIILSVESLKKAYGNLKAVDDISFQVEKGQIFGLLGPNGAGKTTTLECILGSKKPDSGKAYLLGRDTAERNKQLFERIGVQFQDSNYPDRIKVKELCQMYSSFYSNTGNWRDLIDHFQLNSKENEFVSCLSGGERQKLSLLLALMNNPDVVFLDELTTGLDPEARMLVWSYLEDLKSDGLTILMSSHYMEEVEFLCDRIIILRKGRSVFEGSPGEVINLMNSKNLHEAYLNIIKEGEINEKATQNV